MSRYPARVDGLSGRCFVQENIVSIIRTTPSLQSKENKHYKPSYFSLALKSVESGNYKKQLSLESTVFQQKSDEVTFFENLILQVKRSFKVYR